VRIDQDKKIFVAFDFRLLQRHQWRASSRRQNAAEITRDLNPRVDRYEFHASFISLKLAELILFIGIFSGIDTDEENVSNARDNDGTDESTIIAQTTLPSAQPITHDEMERAREMLRELYAGGVAGTTYGLQ
jgi:hypothetical protein